MALYKGQVVNSQTAAAKLLHVSVSAVNKRVKAEGGLQAALDYWNKNPPINNHIYSFEGELCSTKKDIVGTRYLPLKGLAEMLGVDHKYLHVCISQKGSVDAAIKYIQGAPDKRTVTRLSAPVNILGKLCNSYTAIYTALGLSRTAFTATRNRNAWTFEETLNYYLEHPHITAEAIIAGKRYQTFEAIAHRIGTQGNALRQYIYSGHSMDEAVQFYLRKNLKAEFAYLGRDSVARFCCTCPVCKTLLFLTAAQIEQFVHST